MMGIKNKAKLSIPQGKKIKDRKAKRFWSKHSWSKDQEKGFWKPTWTDQDLLPALSKAVSLHFLSLGLSI